MKQENINKAFHSLNKLKGYKLPVKKAYGIYKLMKAIEQAHQFAFEEEKKYLEEYHGAVAEDGTIVFASPVDCAAFKDKLEALYEIEVEVELDPVVLFENDLGDQQVTAEDISNLEGFISFEI